MSTTSKEETINPYSGKTNQQIDALLANALMWNALSGNGASEAVDALKVEAKLRGLI